MLPKNLVYGSQWVPPHYFCTMNFIFGKKIQYDKKSRVFPSASSSGGMSTDIGEDLSETLQVSDLVESVADEIFREFDEENEGNSKRGSTPFKEEMKEDEIVFPCHFCGKTFTCFLFDILL